MLIYAIVLIVMMLITNNPLVKDFMNSLKSRLGRRQDLREAVDARRGTGGDGK